MIELAFLACLSAEPEICEDKAMQFADLSVMTCMMGAQPQLAQWQSEHPGWVVQRWSCRSMPAGRST
ncbi:hypothetical protein ACFPOC_05750 [Rubellimicrobium aerolatum]|uniref:Uncharacterized protein n=2 Tax=Rubellimicrobium aerolatum TaxID=490979 RepID=A0ABW0SAE4_9RHOB|nr:hypothetical protein [Rubellimicrobium aerolatum]